MHLQVSIVVFTLTILSLTGKSFSQQCLNCISEKFLNADFSNVDVLEDRDCEMGVFKSEFLGICNSVEICITIDGIATYDIEGYGKTDTLFVRRMCTDPIFLDSSTRCMTGPTAERFVLSLDHHLELDGYIYMSSFDGTVCPCNDDFCNDEVIRPVLVKRSHTPAPEATGLQCALCVDADIPGQSYSFLEELDNPHCEAGNLTASNVFYQTCSGNGACVTIDGSITESGTRYNLYQRACVHGFLESYSKSDKMFCFSRSQSASVGENILLDEEDYYFGNDFTFDGVVCYCTSDLCNLPGRGVASRPTGEGDGDGTSSSLDLPPVAIVGIVVVVVVLVICCAVASVVKKIGIFR
ncbi:uncharacterized protein [Apostichopus japonicus]|uniref:uncharacterized protein n=1 Tax=Stichopus japonicus TaxID=307972 RepID=UPI003AB15564